MAWTAEVEEIADEMPTYPRGDGLAWEVFETGEKQIHDDVSQAPGRLNPETNVRSQMLLPLGEHGTLLVSSRTVGAFDETDVSLAQTLASHATTALTRLAHEQELKREHNRFEALFETIPEPVINVAFTDEGTLLRDVNEAFEEIFGYAKCDVVGADVNDLIVPETEAARAEAEHIDERASSGAQLTHEVQRETTDGLRDFLFRSAPVRESDQTPQQFGVYVDITERKRHERRIETLIDNLPGVVYRCRNEKGWPIAEIRGAVEELTGYTAAELEDGGFEERLVHPDDQEAVWREVQAALADGEPFELTYRILTKDGTTRWVWERGQRVAREHRDEDVLEGFITDITERKADERELERQIERLERFASVVSHDLRNPLNVAHGRIELEREANASEHLDAAQEAVERGLDLVHDLLALAREGEQVQEAGPVALSGALERCWQNVETDDATLAVETERTIRADPTRVEQLLENLLRNAVRHGGSDVTVTLGDLPDGFYIEDDGPGIAEPAREKIFQMGYSTDDEGTGFGLNIVREIVAAHGWEIAATDSATGGARFEITGVQDAR